jgi:ribonuclease HIII
MTFPDDALSPNIYNKRLETTVMNINGMKTINHAIIWSPLSHNILRRSVIIIIITIFINAML